MNHAPDSSQDAAQDAAFEQQLGMVLQTGVLVAATVVFAGAIVFLVRRGGLPADYHDFHGEPDNLRSVSGILRSAAALSGRGLIQLGLLLLLATPVVRVAAAVAGFARQRDWLYVGIASLVLALLLVSLIATT